jgi:hypothetical protein
MTTSSRSAPAFRGWGFAIVVALLAGVGSAAQAAMPGARPQAIPTPEVDDANVQSAKAELGAAQLKWIIFHWSVFGGWRRDPGTPAPNGHRVTYQDPPPNGDIDVGGTVLILAEPRFLLHLRSWMSALALLAALVVGWWIGRRSRRASPP